MSKERLEELLELHEKAVVAYEDCDFLEMRGYLETLFLEGFIDYLIEQAERFEVLSEQHDEALMQNKRYREAREIIEQVYKENYVRNAFGYEDGFLDGLDTAINIIDKSLEE